MAVAKFWDAEWEIYSKIDDLYAYMKDKRGYDSMDEYIREDVLLLRDIDYTVLEKLVGECASRVYNALRHHGEEGKTDINEVVRDVKLLVSDVTLFDKEQIDSHHCRRTEYGVGEHIDDNMWRKPRTLKGGHQRLVMYLRFEQIYTDKYQGENGRERQDPLVLPARIDDETRQRQEERIPESRFAHRAQWRSLQLDPHREDEREEKEQVQDSCRVGHTSFTLPRSPCTHGPKQYRCNCEIYKMLPTHTRFLPPITNIQTAPASII